jgi:hypothetical protein
MTRELDAMLQGSTSTIDVEQRQISLTSQLGHPRVHDHPNRSSSLHEQLTSVNCIDHGDRRMTEHRVGKPSGRRNNDRLHDSSSWLNGDGSRRLSSDNDGLNNGRCTGGHSRGSDRHSFTNNRYRLRHVFETLITNFSNFANGTLYADVAVERIRSFQPGRRT